MGLLQTIAEVEIGQEVSSWRNGNGKVVDKTARTVTVLFEGGNRVKNTYRSKDSFFKQSDF
jgi:hypothetical protein